MEIFNLTLKQMLVMLTLILAGAFLKRKNILSENAGTIMAKLETCIFVPALSLYTMLTNCNTQTFKENYVLILYGFLIVSVAVLVAYPLALICFATPLGLNTIVYPAAYGGETKTGASMAMISHTLSVVTIPLMYLLFIVIL